MRSSMPRLRRVNNYKNSMHESNVQSPISPLPRTPTLELHPRHRIKIIFTGKPAHLSEQVESWYVLLQPSLLESLEVYKFALPLASPTVSLLSLPETSYHRIELWNLDSESHSVSGRDSKIFTSQFFHFIYQLLERCLFR